MTEPTSPFDRVPTAPRFRIVSDSPRGNPDAGPSEGPTWSSVPHTQLVAADSFEDRFSDLDGDRQIFEMTVPLVLSIARIRTEADGALALSGIIETASRGYHIELPCGQFDDATFRFVASKELDVDGLAAAIDIELKGQVRATDLAGALEGRLGSRISAV